MKKFILLITLTFPFIGLFAKIKNGYENQLQNSHVTLQVFESMLQDGDNISPIERRKIKSLIEVHKNRILYYRLTEQLLNQLLVVVPEIYKEIDNLKDRLGRVTDVAIKLMPKEQSALGLKGATFVAQARHDVDKSISEYGEGTISVEIWDIRRALHALCHELGHVKYIVPNFALYLKFYAKLYNSYARARDVGHHKFDNSGRSAVEFEDRFRKNYRDYLKRKESVNLISEVWKPA